MVGPISSDTNLHLPPPPPKLTAAIRHAAPAGFDEEAVRVELQAVLEPPAVPARDLGPGQLLGDLLRGFAKSAQAGQVIQRTFQAIRSKVQAFSLDLTAQRAEGLRKTAAHLTLLGGTNDSIAEDAETLARQAKRKAGGTQASMRREDRLANPDRPLAISGDRLARFRQLADIINKISLALKLTSSVHRFNVKTREEDEEAASSQNRVNRSLRELDDLKTGPGRYLKPPRLDLKI